MILFNNQFYDRQNFDSHRGAETRLNQVRVQRGDIRQDEIRLKDHRTGQDFNPTFAMRTLYHPRPTRETLQNFLKNRILQITEEEVDAFVPETDDSTTNTLNFISQIRTMAISREDNFVVYERHIHNLQNAAASTITSPSNRVYYVSFTSETAHPSTSSSSRHPSTSSSSRHPPPSTEAVINVDGDSVSSDGDSLFDQAPINMHTPN